MVGGCLNLRIGAAGQANGFVIVVSEIDELQLVHHFAHRFTVFRGNSSQVGGTVPVAQLEEKCFVVGLQAFFNFSILRQGNIEAQISAGIQLDQLFILSQSGLILCRFCFRADRQPVGLGITGLLLADLLSSSLRWISIHAILQFVLSLS